ncbi:hypothetical protein [Bartonella sp. B41]
MEKVIDVIKKLDRKQFCYMFFCVFFIVFCVFVYVFAVRQIFNSFPLRKEFVQQSHIPLDIPTFDLRIYCKEIAASVLPDMKKEVYYRCMNLESEAYFSIREMWDDLSDETKEKCMKMVRPGDGNYFLLRDCFIDEKESEKPKVRNYF